MSSSYDDNITCWSIKICIIFPFPHRQRIILRICNSTSQPLSHSTVQAVGVDGSCVSQTFQLLKVSGGVMLQLGLSDGSLDSLCRAGKKARLPTQPGSVSICLLSICSPCQVACLPSRICIPTYMTCTTHAAELGPLPHTVQLVHAGKAQWFAMSVSSPAHGAMAEVPFSALKSYRVLSTQKTSGDFSSSIC